MNLGMRTHLKMDAAPAAGGGAPGTVVPAPGGGAPAIPEWAGTLPDDLKSYSTTKGWKDIPSVVDSYRNLEKLVGVKDKLLQVPDDLGDAKSMDAVWNRLGRPSKAEEYSIKSADPEFEKFMKGTMFESGMTANQAKTFMEKFEAHIASQSTAFEGKTKAENEQKVNALKTEWGNAYDQNVKVAQAAAKQFGIDTDTVNKMEAAMGFAPLMKLLNSVGSKLGEASFHSGTPTGGNDQILAPAQAREKIDSLIRDRDFQKKLMAGDIQSKNDWEKYNKMAAGNYGT